MLKFSELKNLNCFKNFLQIINSQTFETKEPKSQTEPKCQTYAYLLKNGLIHNCKQVVQYLPHVPNQCLFAESFSLFL